VFWCLSLFLFCVKLAEKNKILPVGHQPAGPLDMCFVIPFLSESFVCPVLFIPFLSPFGSRTSAIPAGGAPKQGPEQRLKVRKALEVHANMIRSNTEWEMGQQVRSRLALQKFYVQCCVIDVIKCLKVSLNVFCLMSKSALEIVVIVLCFFV
jgi:hypothetical protein